MGMSLEEYATLHPKQPDAVPQRERAQMHATAESIKDRQQERAEAEHLKESILQQLEAGNAPETVLYTAINAIGLLTHDPDFTAAAQRSLESVYADLAQQSLLTDTAAVAAHRLEDKQREYTSKLKGSLKRQLSGCKRIEAALQEAMQAADALDTEPDT